LHTNYRYILNPKRPKAPQKSSSYLVQSTETLAFFKNKILKINNIFGIRRNHERFKAGSIIRVYSRNELFVD
jgi:hypothetical protein